MQPISKVNQDTVVTALADGAKNCWSVISHQIPLPETRADFGLVRYCFQTVKKALGEVLKNP